MNLKDNEEIKGIGICTSYSVLKKPERECKYLDVRFAHLMGHLRGGFLHSGPFKHAIP